MILAPLCIWRRMLFEVIAAWSKRGFSYCWGSCTVLNRDLATNVGTCAILLILQRKWLKKTLITPGGVEGLEGARRWSGICNRETFIASWPLRLAAIDPSQRGYFLSCGWSMLGWIHSSQLIPNKLMIGSWEDIFKRFLWAVIGSKQSSK